MTVWLFSGRFWGKPRGEAAHPQTQEADLGDRPIARTFSGALKKKLGPTLTPEKPEDSERVYHIIVATTNETGL
ncbi:hypothetical protein [Nitrosospira multiformis]|uniref:hypothetical protein n=1 Tax=Nitrosospira multiformis TaxID=1231 RepID=UPI001160D991|nr:hypothetical protein [Nitrosospira multiformis]